MTKKKKISQEKHDLSDLKAMLDIPVGRRVLGRLIAASGIMSSTFHPDERLHLIGEGKREFGLWIFNEVQKVSEGLPLTILREYYDERRTNERINESNRTESERPEPGADNPDTCG